MSGAVLCRRFWLIVALPFSLPLAACFGVWDFLRYAWDEWWIGTPVNDEPLPDVVKKLQAIEADWKTSDDPLRRLAELRSGSGDSWHSSQIPYRGIPSQCHHVHPEPPHERCYGDFNHPGPHTARALAWPNAKDTPVALRSPAKGFNHDNLARFERRLRDAIAQGKGQR